MNKKISIFVMFGFIFLLSSTAVFANEVLNPREGDSYNLGNTIVITGFISLNETVKGAEVSFYAISPSLNKSAEIAQKYYSFDKDSPVTFSQINKGTLTWKIPASLNRSDDWKILVNVSKGGENLLNITSGPFAITNKISILVGLNSYLFNLGEKLNVIGSALYSRGDTVDGIVSITLSEKTAGTVLADTATSKLGYISYSYTFKPSNAPGNYSIQVDVKDSDGNYGTKTITNIILSNRLNMNCTINKTSLSPGESVLVLGGIKNVHGVPYSGVNVSALVADPTEEKTLEYNTLSDQNGNFVFNIQMPKLASPGKYTISIISNDNYGNTGQCDLTINVGILKNVSASLNLNSTNGYLSNSIPFSYIIKNNGNVNLTGTIKLYIDNNSIALDASNFTVARGMEVTLNRSWVISGTPGNHSLRAEVFIDGEKLFETSPQSFTIQEHKNKKYLTFKLTNSKRILLLFLLIVLFIIYLKRKDIREHFWRREFEKIKKKKFTQG